MLPYGWQVTHVPPVRAPRELLDLRNAMLETVCSIFEVPKGLLTGDYGNQAPATMAREIGAAFQETTIDAQATIYGEAFTNWARFYDPQVTISHEREVWRNPTLVAEQENHRLATGQATINDIRLEKGLPALSEENANIAFFDDGAGLRPISQLTTSRAPAPPACLLYTSPSPRDRTRSRMPSSA